MISNQTKAGVLYIVATPIGNLDDLSPRAVSTLGKVDLVLAEDTRHSRKLLSHFGIKTSLFSLHEHNEKSKCDRLINQLEQGKSMALISDAGTPLISDPGFPLVSQARRTGLEVVPLPGPCAAIAALSVSGIGADRFVFEGFLPAKPGRRRRRMEAIVGEERTLIFYESVHRIEAMMADLEAVFGLQRQAVVARELTKMFETVKAGTLAELNQWLRASPQQVRGEFVVVVEGVPQPEKTSLDGEDCRIMGLLLELLPPGKAAEAAAKIRNKPRKIFYQWALEARDH